MTQAALTDTQRIILSNASMRPDGSVLPLPRSTKLNTGAVGVVLKSLLGKAFVKERPAQRDDVPWRETETGDRVSLVISPEGFAAIGVATDEEQASDPHQHAQISAPQLVVAVDPAVTSRATSPKAPRKLDLLIATLGTADGATIAELMQVSGWQAHSVRGAMAGALKKRGITVTSDKLADRGRVYRIVAATVAVADAGGAE